MSLHMPGHAVHIRAPILHFPGTPSTLCLSLLSQLPICYILLFFITYCVPQLMYMIHLPPFSFLCLPHMTFPSYSCLHMARAANFWTQGTLLLCPIGWLFPSEGKWVETCWFVSSSLAYIDPVLFCKQLSCRCKPPRAVKKKNWS